MLRLVSSSQHGSRENALHINIKQASMSAAIDDLSASVLEQEWYKLAVMNGT